MKKRFLVSCLVGVLALSAFQFGCSSGLESVTSVAVSSVVAPGLLKDINSGVPQAVHTKWIEFDGSLYFVANDDHQLWKSTSSGVSSVVNDLGLSNTITMLIADERDSQNPTAFYFIVNGVQIWRSTGVTSALVTELQDGDSIISATAIGSALYYQADNFKVYRTSVGFSSTELTTVAASFSAAVTFVPALTTMYFHGNHATDHVVYSHSGTASATTIVQTLGLNASVGTAGVILNNYYFQVNDTDGNQNDDFVFKSIAGAAAAEVQDDTSVSFVDDVTFEPGTANMYVTGNNPTNKNVYSHASASAATVDMTLVEALGTNASISSAEVLGDDLYFQVEDTDSNENDEKILKSVAGAAGNEIQDNANSSFAADVTFVPGTTIMYMHGNAPANQLVYSHTGVAATDATLVLAMGTNAVARAAETVGNHLYFQVEDSDANENDERVYKSTTGAVVTTDIDATSGTNFADDVEFVAGASTMYIIGNDAADTNIYSHTSTATTATTAFIGGTGALDLAKMRVISNTLFFHGETTPIGLFASVTGAVAKVVSEFAPSQDDTYLCGTAYTPVSTGTRLFFVANDGIYGCELWTTTGMSASTTKVTDVNAGFAHSNPSDLTLVGTKLYFTALDKDGVRGLYYSSSPYTSASQVTLTGADAAPDLRFLTAVGTKLYFAADILGVPTLYAHTGTAAAVNKTEAAGSTALILDAAVTPSIVALGSTAIIRGAPVAGVNYELYYSSSSDAVATSATLIKEINAAASSLPILSNVIHNGGTLFFTADDATNGRELWKTEGTLATTEMVRNINQDSAGAANSNPTLLTLSGDKLFFKAVDGASAANDSELWVSSSPFLDATKLTSFANASNISNIHAVDGEILFTASEDNITTAGVYKSEGSVSGTVRLRGGIAIGQEPSFNSLYANLGDFVFFVLSWGSGSNDYGLELWTTNRETSGTSLLKDIYFADEDGVADDDDFAVVGNNLVFVANNGTNGSELWSTTSTAATPTMLENINPDDAAGVAPTLLGVTSNAAYYLVDDGVSGLTIYKVD